MTKPLFEQSPATIEQAAAGKGAEFFDTQHRVEAVAGVLAVVSVVGADWLVEPSRFQNPAEK